MRQWLVCLVSSDAQQRRTERTERSYGDAVDDFQGLQIGHA